MAISSNIGEVVAYVDETGHSKDHNQRFNGIAGLIAPANHWERLEEKWAKTLTEFKISCFHAKEFAASRGEFYGWSEVKRQKLLRKLLDKIAGIDALPIGQILCMDDFRGIAEQHQQRHAALPDPYHLAFGAVLGFVAGFLERHGNATQQASVVFSEQVEFKNEAMRFYEEICAVEPLLRKRTKVPSFADMRNLVPLQAADLVAYELYKEYERLRGFRAAQKARYGFEQLVKISKRLGFDDPMFVFQNKSDIAEAVTRSVAEQRTRSYWERRRNVRL
jgi:hypothetical protein